MADGEWRTLNSSSRSTVKRPKSIWQLSGGRCSVKEEIEVVTLGLLQGNKVLGQL
jgi:hypothetical protein